MNATRRKQMLIVLAVILTVALCCAGAVSAFALTGGDTIQYPFRTGNGAYANSPTWTGATVNEDYWQFLQIKFAETNMTNASYFAIQMKVTGSPRLTIGAIDAGGSRIGTFTGGKTMLFVTENGAVTALGATANGDTPVGSDGMLLLPVADLSWQNGSGNIAKINSYFFTANALWVRDYSVTVGEVGYYTGDPADGGTFTKLLDFSGGENKAAFYNDNGVKTPLTFPSDEEIPEPVLPDTMDYPFKTGDLAFKNAMLWSGPTAQYVPGSGEPVNNFQKLSVQFDSASVDLSEATYLAVQYYAKADSPGLEYMLVNGTASYSIAGNNSKKIYSISESGAVTAASVIAYDASSVSGLTGTLLIPMDSMSWKSAGSAADKNLDAVTTLVFSTNSVYNWNYEVVIGEIGYYTGTLGEADCTFTKILTVDEAQADKFGVATDAENGKSSLSVYKIDQKVYGDTEIDWFATNKTAASFGIWDGGSLGEVAMTTDTYGDDAVKMKATGVNPTGDQYTAITLADGIRFDWNDKKGITFWAKNDSDTEVSFNVEMDCKNTVAQETGNKTVQGRFNIKQGYRFWLYDVNTGKQTIYMTRPCATLPVGFEGWVRIPFEAFHQADWSITDHGAYPRDKFLTDNSYVSYLAITIHAPSYTDKAFTLNKIGSYSTTPHFISALVKPSDTAKSIPMLMGLSEEE